MCFEHELAGLFGVAAHRPGSFSHPFPSSFQCSFSVVSLFPFPTWGFIAGLPGVSSYGSSLYLGAGSQ